MARRWIVALCLFTGLMDLVGLATLTAFPWRAQSGLRVASEEVNAKLLSSVLFATTIAGCMGLASLAMIGCASDGAPGAGLGVVRRIKI